MKTLINSVERLQKQPRLSAEHTRWVTKCLTLLEDVFGQDSLYFRSFIVFDWSEHNSFPIPTHYLRSGYSAQEVVEAIHQAAYVKQLGSVKGLLQAASEHLARADKVDDIYKGKNTGPESSLILKIMRIAEQKLRKTVRVPPTNEKEIQDVFENLLIGADIPYSRETASIEYSTKTYIPDFTMEKINLAIEIKFCGTRKDREKEIIAEINDDILAYGTKFGNLMFIVYDIGIIRDVETFTAAFESSRQDVIVRVIKH